MGKLGVISGVAIMGGAFGLLFALHACHDEVVVNPGPSTPAPGTAPVSSAGHVDHSSYDALLKKYVNDKGLVNYKDFVAKDHDTLKQYLAQMSGIDPSSLTDKHEQLAYWINVYNALTLEAMLHFYPLKSIKDHVSAVGFSVWKDYKIKISGKEYSLDDIENAILRKMGEPRIHFSIVCASMGCPRLRNEAYVADRLDAQLDDQAKDMFGNPAKFKIDRTAKKVWFSSIFDWFGGDFGGTDRAKLDFAKKYVSADDAAFLSQDGLSISYLDYDWSLNEQKP